MPVIIRVPGSVLALAPNTRLGIYDVLTLIGSGGMGEVYRARDSRLGRDVAIKILPAAMTADADRVARFEREAQLLASLHHPNIAAIFGLEVTGGLTALVLEFVGGETLADRLRRGPIAPRDAIALARQVAEGLDAAHERGIVHRDLKPANVIVTPEGVVKILDFGLAKSSDTASSDALTHSPTMLGPTGDGVLLGTAPYMSPEQARGKSVDKRTDIWAFGCVLYEMLTARRAFGGDTTSDTVAAILERDPDWNGLPAGVPAAVARTLRDCLVKDPKHRLRDIGDARFDDDAKSVTPDRTDRKRTVVLGATATAVAAAALAAVPLLRGPGTPVTTSAAIERLTFDAARLAGTAISADGRLLAFGSDRSGRGDLDIWVQQAVGGSPIRITDDQADDIDPDFSPDGSEIAFRSDRGSGGVYLTSSLGSRPARLVVAGGRTPRFSPDGKWIAYWTGQFRGDPSGTVSSLFIMPTAGGAPVQLAKDFYVARDPVWAPDSKSLAIVGRRDRSAPLEKAFDIWWIPINGDTAVKTGALDRGEWRSDLVRERLTIGQWTPGGLLVANGGDVWSLRLATGSGRIEGNPELLAHGAGTYRTPAASTKGDIVFADVVAARIVERAPLSALDSTTALPVELYADGNAFPRRVSQTSDGGRIVLERPTGRRAEVWINDVRTGDQQMVVSVDTDAPIFPSVSPHGSRIGYTVAVDQRRSVTVNGRAFVIDTSAGVPEQLCDDCGFYQFLLDDRHAMVTAGDTEIRVVDTTSHEMQTVVRATTERVERPSVSPDDRIIAWRRTIGTAAKVLVATMPTSGRVAERWSEVEEPTTTGRPAGWSADSHTLYLLLDTDGHRCL